ncbi:MAG: PBECR4 domain-containing protein [Oscillospiraceae bacterium]|nr:PBECR4 domain-containing protein [Oscillospiraceae bacterium]
MTNQQVANEIIGLARRHEENLNGKNLLIIFSTKDDIEHIETEFLAKHFLHLTGVERNYKQVNSSIEFYNLAITGTLKDFHFSQDNTRLIEKKMSALHQTTMAHVTSKEIGDYNGNGFVLKADKLAGTVKSCLGFELDDSKYIPKTNLQGNVRLFITKPHPIFAILRKDIKDEKYSEVTYIKKGLDLSTLTLPNEILSKLSDNAKLELKQAIDSPNKSPEKSPIAADVKTMFEQILTYEQIPDDSKHIFNPKFQSKPNTTDVQEAIDDTNKPLNSFEKVKRDDTVR